MIFLLLKAVYPQRHPGAIYDEGYAAAIIDMFKFNLTGAKLWI